MNILIIRAGNIGDVLMVTPLVRVLKRRFPESSVDFVTSVSSQQVLMDNANIRNVFVHRKQKRFLRLMSNQWLYLQMRRRRYRYCFNLEKDVRFKKMAYAVTGRDCLKIGFSGPGDEYLDRTHEFSYEGPHVIEAYLNLAVEHCQVELQSEDVLMDYPLLDDTKFVSPALGIKTDRYAVIHSGATECYPNRIWRPDRWAQVAKHFIRRGISVVLTGQGVHQPLVDEILRRSTVEERAKISTVIDRSFKEVAQIISGARVVVCSDTGILHLARALRVPVLGLFGPSNPRLTGTLGPGSHRMIRNDFPCGPCNYYPEYRYEDKKNCLDGAVPPCMNSITTDQVCDALDEMLR